MRKSVLGQGVSIIAVLLTAASLQGAINHQITLPAGESWCSDSMINGLFTEINTYRGQNNAAALSLDPLGMKDAEIRATQFIAYMATHIPGSPGFDPHTGYDTTAASLGYDIVSENLAYMDPDPTDIVYDVWQDPLHIAAMLSAQANVMGVSCVYSNDTPYWTYEPGYATSIPPPSTTPPGGLPVMDSEESEFLTLINSYRAQNGAGPLEVSIALENAAQWMSNDMATHNYASHTDSLGRSTETRLIAFGYPYAPWGEDLAGGDSDAQSTLIQWETACDPDTAGNCTYAHRQNLLNPGFLVIGIGRAYNANSTYGWYWTTDFGGVVDQTMTPTPPAGTGAPTITAFSAMPASITAGQSATLMWIISGTPSSVTLDNGIGNVTAANSVSVSPTQTTTYTLTATNSGGTATAQAVVTVNPLPGTAGPTPPVLISAVAMSAREVNLAWSASSDTLGVAGYQVFRNASFVTSLAGTTLSWSDTSVSPGTTYIYTVRAYDLSGNFSAVSNSIAVTTPATSVAQGPTAPTLYPGSVSATQLSLLWTASSDNIGVTGYQITRNGAIITSVPGTVLSWVDTTVSPNTTYEYVITAFDAAGNYSAPSNTVQVTTPAGGGTSSLPPAAPVISSFIATPPTISAGQASTLSWNVSGATSLSVSGGIGTVLGATSASVSPRMTTTYTLTATNSSGSATATAIVTVTEAPPATETEAPTTPPLYLGAVSPTEVSLYWLASSSTVGVAGYQISRDGSVIASVSWISLEWVDTTVTPGSSYTYVIKAFDHAGNYSAPSNTVQVTTPAE